MIRSRRDLLARGWTERSIDHAARTGELHRIRRGSFIASKDWSDLWPEGRHLAHLVAVARDSAGGGVASHVSAAVLWGLPLYRVAPRRVHQTFERHARVASGPDVMRHVAPLPRGDVTIRSGIRCTTLERTVFDLARSMPVEAALACADAGERQMVLVGREWDQCARSRWRRSLEERLDHAAGARGIRQARWILEFADGRAELPGESVSRLQLVRIGFSTPRLQVPVPSPSGGRYWIDFALDEVKAFGEFDGLGKYTEDDMRDGRSPASVLLAEKRREDWVRGTTQWRFARWGSEHCVTPGRLADRLRSFGIMPPA